MDNGRKGALEAFNRVAADSCITDQFRVLLCASSLATEAEAVLATKQEYFAERSLGR